MGDEAENFNKKLFDHTQKGEWNDVLKIYESNPLKAGLEQITQLKDTALHIAVASGKTDIAIRILDIIKDEPWLGSIVNHVGNTPLHVAAQEGDTGVCQKVKEMNDHEIMTVLNDKGQSALFLAARHGKEEAFHVLYSMLSRPEEYEYLMIRSTNRDTILHVALANENFRLSMRILNLYPTLGVKVNLNGETPLHILAQKPNAFKSSTPLNYFDNLLYESIAVNIELEDEKTNHVKEEIIKGYPKNWHTCMFFVAKLIYCIFGEREKNDKAGDVENPNKKSDHVQPTGSDGSSNTMIDDGAEPKLETNTKQVSDASSSTTASKDEPKSETSTKGSNITGKKKENESYPYIYASWVLFVKSLPMIFVFVFGMGRFIELKKKKQIHERAIAIMNRLVPNYMTSTAGSTPGDKHHEFTDDQQNPFDVISSINDTKDPKNTISPKKTSSTALLIAAKNGVMEMVKKILDDWPEAIYDEDEKKKNVVLLAIEYRQPQVYQYLLNLKSIPKETVFGQLDVDGNSGLHLAATQCDEQRPWLIPGSALQMQWEIKWYESVKATMPRDFFAQRNKAGKTPKTIFLESHKSLLKEGIDWIGKTSESCSLVAALVATVAFATSTTVPGGVYQDNGPPVLGTPILGDKPGFHLFAIASLAALCLSITALIFFLSILTSRYQEKDFAEDLPLKLLLGLTSLFMSIVAMLVSFCSAHVFILQYDIKFMAYPFYAALSIPISFFAVTQLSLYYDLVKAIFHKVPQRS